MPREAMPRIWRDKYVTYIGGNRKILCALCAGEGSANKELYEYQEELKTRAEGRLTVAECAAEFLEHRKGIKAQRTYDGDRNRLKRLLKHFGSVPLLKFMPSHADKYFSRLKLDGLGIASINRHVQVAKSLFNFACARLWIDKNPFAALKQVKEFPRRRTVSDEEFEELLAACDEFATTEEKANGAVPLMKDILQVLRRTALRPGELRILRFDHLRLDEGFIIIPPEEHKTGTTSREPKPRIVPFLADVQAIFVRRQAEAVCRLVFPGANLQQLTADALSGRFERIRRRAGLDKPDNGEVLCLYHLRHSRITEIGTEEDWSNPALLSEYAGNSPAITNRYIHPNKKLLREQLCRGETNRLNRAV